MGVVDFLKKIFPPGKNPLLAMEPQCVRYQWLTLRLPADWRFTQADGRSCKASGPGGCSAEFFIVPAFNRYVDVQKVERNRAHFAKIMRNYIFKSRVAVETILPTGLLWMEASDIQGQEERLQIALFNPQSRNPEFLQPTSLQVTCTMRRASAGAAFSAERFEQLRGALRSIEWN